MPSTLFTHKACCELENVPRFIRIDGGVVNKDTAAGYQWLGEHLLI
jgi:hypothetical protein